MISKTLSFLVFLAFISAAGGYVLLTVWDMPIKQKMIEKPIDTSGLLKNKS